ncbi:MAG: class II aldolase/adducin family protein [Pseudomonadota bacterium]
MRDPFTRPDDLADLAALSARIGADPLLIQAAGGNTSVKAGDVMWIKASGTLLADARAKDIFVPVDLPAMRAAFSDPNVDADQPAQFTLGGAVLRPSIETSLHAVMPQRVVVHVHCVETIAHAVRADAEALLSQKLAPFNWCFVPYAKPGAELAQMVHDRLQAGTDVVVLRNHGLIVAAESVAGAADLQARVTAALRLEPGAPYAADRAGLEALLIPGWEIPEDAGALQELSHPARAAQAAKGSLYPDHVLFCGIAVTLVETLPDPAEAPPIVVVPGKGVAMREDAPASGRALARCLGDVLARVPVDAALTYLSYEQNAELLDWDAEKYRKALNA